MPKPLEQMTLEELWQLFPIFLTEHKEEWADWYRQEESSILGLLDRSRVSGISHIGSTSVPGIWAKNIVDILLEVASAEYIFEAKDILVQNGWRLMNEEALRADLNKGYTENGFADKVFHLHIRLAGDNDELYFRDYLRVHPEVAKAYQDLKLSLWKQYEHDRDGYTDAKGDFIRKYTELAKLEIRNE